MLVTINHQPIRITSPFGAIDSAHPKPHTGIDMAFEIGSPIYSPANGVIELVDYGSKNIGKGIIIKTEEGERLILGHLSQFQVKAGEKVNIGEQLALSGNTGHSTGPHLHIGLKNEQGEFIDPSKYVEVIQDLQSIKGSFLDKIGETLFSNDNTVAEFFLDKSIQYGFVSINEILFLLPAALFIIFRLYLGKNPTTGWILPMLYSFFITEKFWG
jgi:hypothetical protein